MTDIRILLVDDEPDIREVATLSLQLDPEIEVRAVDGGDEAIAVFTRGDWMPDVVLLDVMMPGMDGPGVLKALRELGAATPVVFITARAQSHERSRLIDLGALGVITKPFDPMSLAKDLRAVLASADCPA